MASTSHSRPPLLEQLVRGTLDRARAQNASMDAVVPSSAEARALLAYVTTRFTSVHDLLAAFAPRFSLLVDDDCAHVFAASPDDDTERETQLLVVLLSEATHSRFAISEVRHAYGDPSSPRGRRALTFSAAMLDLPLGLAALSATATLRPVPAATLAERVRASLRRQLGSGETATLDRVANELGMSRRALQRGLQTGAHYQEIAAQVFSERAALLLRNRPDLSIKEVACMLGFSGTRAFTRAFRRWFAQNPSEARRAPPESRVSSKLTREMGGVWLAVDRDAVNEASSDRGRT